MLLPLFIYDNKQEEIRNVHGKLVHRGAKAVTAFMKENGHLETSESEVREAIKDCAICRAYNPSRDRGYRHVPAYEVGEKVAIDIIEPRDHTYIVTAIDYFSRQGFARVLKNKEAKGLLKFIQDIHKVLKIKTLITDGARENCSAEIKAWLEKQGITHHITSPYHHESNGRVERFNRTVQEGLNKAKVRGTLAFRLGKVIEAYNTIRHEALDMSPNQAAQLENWEKVKQKQFAAKLRAEMRGESDPAWEKLKVGDRVLLRVEVRSKKGGPKFADEATVEDVGEFDTYTVRVLGKRSVKRHVSPLRLVQRAEGGKRGNVRI